MKNEQEIIKKYQEAIASWEAQSATVKSSKEYQDKLNQLSKLDEDLAAMIPVRPVDAEYEEIEKNLLARIDAGEVPDWIVPKYSEKKEVNSRRFYEAIGEDIGIFMDMVSITQAKLKDFAKTQPGLKKSIESCIEVISRKASGFELVSEKAALDKKPQEEANKFDV